MRLLMVTNYFEGHRGGVEIVAGALARLLGRRGVSVAWRATGTPPNQADESMNLRSMPASNFAEARLGFPFPLLAPQTLPELWADVSAADVVVLHDTLCIGSICAFVFARLRRVPILIVQHIGLVPYKNIVLRKLQRLSDAVVAQTLLRSADQVVFISETTRKHFSRVRFRSPPLTIWNGVDTDTFRPDQVRGSDGRAAFGLPADRPIALFVGRFVEKKGLHLIHQLASIRPDVTWAFAGWGSLDPQLWGLDNVQVLRNLERDELADLYRACNLLILPSYGEGLPLVIQEALACGLPVICGDETAAADPQAAAWLRGVDVAAPNAVAVLSHAVDVTLDEAREGGETARAARASFAKERYTWETAADGHFAVLTRLTHRDARHVRLSRHVQTPSMESIIP